MGDLTSRPCVYQRDLAGITEMLLAYRAATGVRAYPTVWRVRLLLTSRVWEPLQDARVWERAPGRIVGLAMLWRRQLSAPYLVLDRFVHPQDVTRDLVEEMLRWGCDRAAAIAAEQRIALTLFAGALALDIYADDALGRSGFIPIARNPDGHNVYFARSLRGHLPIAMLPPGYVLRPLQGVEDLEAYQGLYSFALVHPQHQRELLASDEYSHLVVVDSEGGFAAYCECSICRAEWQIGRERIGWIDYVETREDLRRQGLGGAVLFAGLARLRKWGANMGMLVTVSTNAPAIRLYAKAGLKRVHVSEPARYQKQIALEQDSESPERSTILPQPP